MLFPHLMWIKVQVPATGTSEARSLSWQKWGIPMPLLQSRLPQKIKKNPEAAIAFIITFCSVYGLGSVDGRNEG